LATKTIEFSKMTRNNAITSFKVIQGNSFWYQWKASMRLCKSE